jgi:hypothetical protein
LAIGKSRSEKTAREAKPGCEAEKRRWAAKSDTEKLTEKGDTEKRRRKATPESDAGKRTEKGERVVDL